MQVLLLLSLMLMSQANADEPRVISPLPTEGWRLITDGVMGGVSRGEMLSETRQGRACIGLRGQVSTDNNGGFIQIALDISDFASLAKDHDGLRLEVIGNGEQYNVHLRTADLWFPWQSFRASFDTSSDWQRIHLPFSEFQPYKSSASLRPARLRRVGIVAIGRDFDADVCVSGVALYRSRD